MQIRLGDIVDSLGGQLHGERDKAVTGLAPLESAGADQLSFLSHPKYQSQLATTQAGCVIVSPAMRDAALARGAAIVADDPYLYFARVTQLWKARRAPAAGAAVHPSAVVDPEAVVDPSARIGPLCVVERGARIGAGTVLRSRVSVGEDCVIGARCILHPGVVIGADGFGFAPRQGEWEKIEQLGAVRIGDDVEIGANTCIDRGALADTVIEDGVKLDNLIQVGHNVRIGRHTAIAGCAGIAGSATIGAYCTIGGSAGILGHLTVCDRTRINAMALVTSSIDEPGEYSSGTPLMDTRGWRRSAARFRQLDALARQVQALEKEKT